MNKKSVRAGELPPRVDSSERAGCEVSGEVPARRKFLKASLLGASAVAISPRISFGTSREAWSGFGGNAGAVPSSELDETTVTDLQSAMASGRFTAQAITEKYLARIEAVDKHGPAINSVIEVNPDALSIAKELDRERKQKHLRGPLHGIPILIKDNIDTSDRMITTAGSLALVGSKPPKDSMVAQKLREAGAVILG